MNLRKPTLLALLLSLPFLSAAQDKPAGDRPTGVLLLAHGGAKNWNDEVDKLASKVGKTLPVEVAYGMASKRTMQDAIDRLVTRGVREIVAVPLFVSSHSSVITATQYLLGLRPDAPPELAAYARMSHDHRAHAPAQPAASSFDPSTPVNSSVPIRMTAALDAHPLVAEILLSRARGVSKEPAHETVVVVAHGPVSDEENNRWLADMASLAGTMRSAGSFERIEYLTVRDDAQEPIRSQATAELRAVVTRAAQRGDRVLVIPLLISYGGIESGIKKRLEGLTYTLSPQALLPDDRLARWVMLVVQGSVPALAATDTQRDPGNRESLDNGGARELLRTARDVRGLWGNEFPGFRADLEVFYKNQSHHGHVTVSSGGSVQVELGESSAKEWATSALSSLAMHSLSRDFDKTDGRYPITFGLDDHSPLGRLIELQQDPYHSSYRVRDNIIGQVSRRMGKQRFTIDVLHVAKDDRGRKTSEAFVVNTFENDSSRFVKSEAFRDEFVAIGDYRLPRVRCVIVTEQGGSWTESVMLSNHRLATPGVVSYVTKEAR